VGSGIHRLIAVALMAVVLGGCVAPVRTDYLAQTNLARCHSFAWQPRNLPTNAGPFQNPVNGERLRMAVTRELATLGWSQAPNGSVADCIVSAAIGVRQQVVDGPYSSLGMGYGRRGFGGHFGWDLDAPYVYEQGSVAINVFDAKTHEPLWHAAVLRNVTTLTGADADRRIRSAVEVLFEAFPAPRP